MPEVACAGSATATRLASSAFGGYPAARRPRASSTTCSPTPTWTRSCSRRRCSPTTTCHARLRRQAHVRREAARDSRRRRGRCGSRAGGRRSCAATRSSTARRSARSRRCSTTAALGEVYFISSSRVNLGLHQRDVSVVWDLGPHDFSILLHWLGELPERVRAVGATRSCRHPRRRVRHAELPLGRAGERRAELARAEQAAAHRVVGSEKMVVYEDGAPEPVRVFDHGVVYQDPETFGEYQLSYRTGDIVSPKLDANEPLAGGARTSARRPGRRCPAVSGVAGARRRRHRRGRVEVTRGRRRRGRVERSAPILPAGAPARAARRRPRRRWRGRVSARPATAPAAPSSGPSPALARRRPSAGPSPPLPHARRVVRRALATADLARDRPASTLVTAPASGVDGLLWIVAALPGWTVLSTPTASTTMTSGASPRRHDDAPRVFHAVLTGSILFWLYARVTPLPAAGVEALLTFAAVTAGPRARAPHRRAARGPRGARPRARRDRGRLRLDPGARAQAPRPP